MNSFTNLRKSVQFKEKRHLIDALNFENYSTILLMLEQLRQRLQLLHQPLGYYPYRFRISFLKFAEHIKYYINIFKVLIYTKLINLFLLQ